MDLLSSTASGHSGRSHSSGPVSSPAPPDHRPGSSASDAREYPLLCQLLPAQCSPARVRVQATSWTSGCGRRSAVTSGTATRSMARPGRRRPIPVSRPCRRLPPPKTSGIRDWMAATTSTRKDPVSGTIPGPEGHTPPDIFTRTCRPAPFPVLCHSSKRRIIVITHPKTSLNCLQLHPGRPLTLSTVRRWTCVSKNQPSGNQEPAARFRQLLPVACRSTTRIAASVRAAVTVTSDPLRLRPSRPSSRRKEDENPNRC